MKGLQKTERCGRVTTNWMVRTNSHTANREVMRDHILALEREVDLLREQLKSRTEARAIIQDIGAKLSTYGSELYKMLVSFNAARAAVLSLTPSERTIFEFLITERTLSNKDIANKLNISERTVKFHISSILQKAGARSRNEL
jgi:DNA-binding NarL/FixJ family response regulator